MTTGPFDHRTYVLRRKVLKLLGADFSVFAPDGTPALFAQLKPLRLREDIRLYDGPQKRTELLTLKARQIIDFTANYDVIDTPTGKRVGALRRSGFKSMVRDEWAILDPDDRPRGSIREDHLGRALLRRFVARLVPQTFHATIDDRRVATYRQRFNPVVQKIEIDFTPDERGLLDRRLGLAAAVLMAAIEGRQS